MKIPALALCSLLTFHQASIAQDGAFRTFTNQQGVTLKAKLLAVNGDQVKIARDDGGEFTLPIHTLSAADQEYVRQQGAVSSAASSGANATGVTTTPSPNDKLAVADLNELVGLSLFGETLLWMMPAKEVADAMKLRPESNTKSQSSFRAYPGAEAKMFGARPYSIALYAERGSPVALSIVYANKGDSFSASGSAEMHFDKATVSATAAKELKKAMDADLEAISKLITAKLGEPRKERFGEGKAGRMNMKRWDWRGHAILLAEAEGEYVGVQIVTQAFADAGGKAERTSDAVIRERSLANVVKRPNGDQIIENIPMVDQGPKGYCVPATVERAMRYLGVPADMYILANAGETGFGGGTSVEGTMQGMARLIRAKGRSYSSFGGELRIKDLAKFIDKGVPVIWGMQSTTEFNQTADRRTKERADITDWAAWKTKVASEASSAVMPKDPEKAHVVLIIGYNKDTDEIAFSDSWGERFMERWISVEEAKKISANNFYVIGF